MTSVARMAALADAKAAAERKAAKAASGKPTAPKIERTATPSPKKADPAPEDGPPHVEDEDVLEDEGSVPKRIILHMPAELTRWLDEEWHRRRLPSRAETIRAILSEARGKP